MVQFTKLILIYALLVVGVFSAPLEKEDNENDVEENESNTNNTDTQYQSPIKYPEEMLKKWPTTKEEPYRAIVPLKIRETDYTKEALETFQAALKDIEEKTCVRFVDPLDHHEDFILVHDDAGKCSSWIGRTGGRQSIKLTNKCMLVRKKCVHELMHALGFQHMHQRYDRDSAITINWENIEEKDRKWFRRFDNEWEAFNTPYDELSCMHYTKKGFSKNGQVTMVTKNPEFQDEIGKQLTLSAGDVQRINRMYKCPGQY